MISIMRIGVIGSMQYAEEMLKVCKELNLLGHNARTSKFAKSFIDKSDTDKETIKLKQKYEQDAIREDCKWIAEMDAILVLNKDKHGIKNYIGGNAFLEMGYVHILGKPMYLMNPIPDMPYYGTEIIAMNPVIINGDLKKIS